MRYIQAGKRMSHTGTTRGPVRSILQVAGSLWFAAVLLILLMVSMACATVVEARDGSDKALATFYGSWWFAGLLALLGVNVLAAMAARYPFSRRQWGFVLTHAAILLILTGAAVTVCWGVSGRVGVGEGQTAKRFSLRGQDVVTIASAVDTSRRVEIAPQGDGGRSVTLGHLKVTAGDYLPDSVSVPDMVDDNARTNFAVELAVSARHRRDTRWVFAGQGVRIAGKAISVRAVRDAETFERLTVTEQPTSRATVEKTVTVEYKNARFEFPLAKGLKQAVPLGETGTVARVVRYLPHAVLGRQNLIQNATTRPINPAIEVELVGPAGHEKYWAFANADVQPIRDERRVFEDMKVLFQAPIDTGPPTPTEIVVGPESKTAVRFRDPNDRIFSQRVHLGKPIAPGGSDWHVTVLRRFDHARIRQTVKPVDLIRDEPTPAIQVVLATAEDTYDAWLQKGAAERVNVDGVPYDLLYGEKSLPLGFDLKLQRFTLGYYPGRKYHRSYESQVTVVDPTTGRSQQRVVGMNHPTSYGGYTLSQSSYREHNGRWISFLGVARDPGKPIVFVGYVAMMAGMLLTLTTRMTGRQTHVVGD